MSPQMTVQSPIIGNGNGFPNLDQGGAMQKETVVDSFDSSELESKLSVG